MNIIELLVKELDQEAAITRKMLNCVSDDDYDWQPHPKSMTVRRLATHLADLGNWFAMTLTTSELDFMTTNWKEEIINDTSSLLNYFERSLANGRSHLEQATEADLQEMWTLRSGEHILSSTTKYEMIRIILGQMIHHRAQLGVFLRLLNIPIPGTYGPSADEMPAEPVINF